MPKSVTSCATLPVVPPTGTPCSEPSASLNALFLARSRFQGGHLTGLQEHQACTARTGNRIWNPASTARAFQELNLPRDLPGKLPPFRPVPADTLAHRLHKLAPAPLNGARLTVEQEWHLRVLLPEAGAPPVLNRRLWSRLYLQLPEPMAHRTISQGFPGSEWPLEGLFRRALAELKTADQTAPLRQSARLPVILEPGDGGILLHETLGHGLEADLFHTGPLGRRPLSPLLTLRAMDSQDPFWHGWSADDTGTPPSEMFLVREGQILATIGLGAPAGARPGTAGFWRRSTLDQPCLPRMFGLYLEPGASGPDEIRDLPLGILARAFGTGRISPERDHYIFEVHQGQWIHQGRPGPPTGPFLMEGTITGALEGIEALGRDYALDRGTCFCTKKGQTLPVRLGQPSLRLREATIHPWHK